MGTKMLSVALAAIALGAVTVAPASAAPEGNRIVEIESVAHGKCVQPAAGGFFLELVTCTGEQRQRWEQIPLEGGRHLVRNISTRECFATMYDLLGTRTCDDDGDPYQVEAQFTELVPDTATTTRIKVGEAYADTSSTDVFVRELADTDHQRWTVREVGTAAPPADTTGQVVRIANVENAFYGCVTEQAGAQLRNTSCQDVPEQRFQRVETGDGTVLRSTTSGMCVSAGRVNAVLVDCDLTSAVQKWVFEPVKTGAFRLRLSDGRRYLFPWRTELWVQDGQRNFSPSDSWVVTAA